MPTYDQYPPNGLDRADGSVIISGTPLGTPTPTNAVKTVNMLNGPVFEELPTSPVVERGEQATIVHTFSCDQTTGLALIAGIGRGNVYTDSGGNITKVLTIRYSQMKGDVCQIEITSEGLNFDVPPDEYAVDVVEFNPSLAQLPRYQSIAQYNTFAADGTTMVLGSQILAWIAGAANQPQFAGQTDAATPINSSMITDAGVLDLAEELLDKERRGEETFYLAGFKVTWSQFFFLSPDLDPGGYIQDPVSSGVLPYYFWSDDGTPFGGNTLTDLAALVAPAFYANGLSWLRMADTVQYGRTWFKLSHSWLGGPYGHWDAQIYASH